MKKIAILLLLTLIVQGVRAQQSNELPKRGYSGDVSLAVGTITSAEGLNPMVNLATSHGFQFNSRLFLGAGVSTLNTQYVTLYGQISNNFCPKHNTHRLSFPFVTLKVGYTASTWLSDHIGDEQGVYIEPQFGWSFYSKGGNMRYKTFAAVSFFNFTLVPQIGLAVQF